MAFPIGHNPVSVFARKNSFYPDLAKGYQASPYEPPIREHGRVDTLTKADPKTVGVTRIH